MGIKNTGFCVFIENSLFVYCGCHLLISVSDWLSHPCFPLSLSIQLLHLFLPAPTWHLLPFFHLCISFSKQVESTNMIYGLLLTFYRKTESEWSRIYPSSARKKIVSWTVSSLRALSA